MSDIRILTAWYEHQKIGQLEDNNGVWSFIYDDHWLNDEQAFSLSPQLNMTQQQHIDNSTHRYVQWFFDNLLPEENARKVIADDKKLDQEDAFGLLTLFGTASSACKRVIILVFCSSDKSPGNDNVISMPSSSNTCSTLFNEILPSPFSNDLIGVRLKPQMAAKSSCSMP